jgi:bifunctional enzyme CysN/CysC
VWLTGLSGAGKSTIANALEKMLFYHGKHVYTLDGDNVRKHLCKDLGFEEVDRIENIRRVGEVAKLMTDAGLIVICSFISPYQSDRDKVRELFSENEFIEVFVDAPLNECIKRDPKGLYKKALNEQIPNFTGITSVYEKPDAPELTIDSMKLQPEEAAEKIYKILSQ